MRIRREDQEIIYYMKLVGAGLGAILSLFVVLGLYNDSKKQLDEERRYLEKNSPLLAMAGLQVAPGQADEAEEMVIRRLSENADQDKAEQYRLKKGFWAGLPLYGIAIICATAGVAGLFGGYWCIWLLAWIGTFATIKLIRSVYHVIWCINPNFDGGKSEVMDEDNNVFVLRDKNRFLPGVLVISMMGVIGLILLSLVVYYLAG